MNRGFAFVEYDTKEEAMKAIDEMNGKMFKGRILAIEIAYQKKKYDEQVSKLEQFMEDANKDKKKKPL